MKVINILPIGIGGIVVTVECFLSNSLPGIHIIGFANRTVEESKDRIRSAFASSQLQLPKKLITINLAPADIPKSDASFDLAIACAVLSSSGMIHKPTTALVTGELGLDGRTRPVRGIIGKLLNAREHGITEAYIPTANIDQARLIDGLKIFPVDSLKSLFEHLHGDTSLPIITAGQSKPSKSDSHGIAIEDIKQQARAKRALTIAAAGRHNILLYGSPGSGKTMLARSLTSILPELTDQEMLEVTHLHSLSGKTFNQLVGQRPFRSPHHSASSTAIVGGGHEPLPGEITLAHHGVLFMDELPEFDRKTIESLRQPIEEKLVHIMRAKTSVTYPCDFMLVATANPCPCGYFGSQKPCSCSPYQIATYSKKLSGPMLDRIDMFVQVDSIAPAELLQDASQAKSSDIRATVLKAVKKQQERNPAGNYNSSLQAKNLRTEAKIETNSIELLNTAAEKLSLSSRSYVRCLRVARTIADIEGADQVSSKHVAEALQFRSNLPQM